MKQKNVVVVFLFTQKSPSLEIHSPLFSYSFCIWWFRAGTACMCLPKWGMANPYPLRLVLPPPFLLRSFEIDGLWTVFGIWVFSTRSVPRLCNTIFKSCCKTNNLWKILQCIWLCLISYDVAKTKKKNSSLLSLFVCCCFSYNLHWVQFSPGYIETATSKQRNVRRRDSLQKEQDQFVWSANTFFNVTIAWQGSVNEVLITGTGRGMLRHKM